MATPYINKKTQKTTSKISGYSPRSTDLFYNPAPKTTNTIRNNTQKLSNDVSNVMSNVMSKVPTMIPTKVPTAVSNVVSKVPTMISKVPTVMSAVAVSANNGGISFFTFLLIVFFLVFLGLTIYLYLEKPKDKDITHLYDPVLNYIKQKMTEIETKAINEKKEEKVEEIKENNNSAIKKLDKSLNKPADDVNKNPVAELKPDEDSKKEMQMNKPVSKAGFCFIGEDRGNRSCIEVGEGDICMSGDIFPTQAICINPRLRQ